MGDANCGLGNAAALSVYPYDILPTAAVATLQVAVLKVAAHTAAASVNRGDQIKVVVSTIDRSYTMEIFRMGGYRAGMGPPKLEGNARSAHKVNALVQVVAHFPEVRIIQIVGYKRHFSVEEVENLHADL